MASPRPARRRPAIRVPPGQENAPAAAPGPFSFVLEGDPVPKGRPRVVNGHTYTDARTVAAERQVRAAALKAGCRPLKGPVRVELRFWRGTARRCDWDNLAKLVCDALNGVAWEDDDQIIGATVTKGLDRERPRTEVLISAVPTDVVPVDWNEGWEGRDGAS